MRVEQSSSRDQAGSRAEQAPAMSHVTSYHQEDGSGAWPSHLIVTRMALISGMALAPVSHLIVHFLTRRYLQHYLKLKTLKILRQELQGIIN